MSGISFSGQNMGVTMSNTKILILKRKEILYTGIFLIMGVMLIILLFCFFSGKSKETMSSSLYEPGVYSDTVTLGENELNISVTTGANQIYQVEITNLNESITTMYPLMEPALEDISTQLLNGVELSEVQISDDCKYTGLFLLNAIDKALEPARKNSGESPSKESGEDDAESSSYQESGEDGSEKSSSQESGTVDAESSSYQESGVDDMTSSSQSLETSE